MSDGLQGSSYAITNNLGTNQQIIYARAREYIEHHIWHTNPFPIGEEIAILQDNAWHGAIDDTSLIAIRTAAVNGQVSFRFLLKAFVSFKGGLYLTLVDISSLQLSLVHMVILLLM